MANPTLEVDIVAKVKQVAGAAAILSFAKEIVGAASDAEQSIGAVDAVFKENSGTVKKWADESAKRLGLAGNDYRELATLIGTQLKAAGTAMSDLAPETDKLISLGADLSAMFGGTTKEAVEALSATMKGEMNPIERYGVSLNQARLQAKAAEMGLEDLWKSGDAATKQQVLMASIMEQTTDALGTNAREAETAQGKWARLSASFEDAKVRMGAALLPAFQALMDVMGMLLPIIEPIVSAVGQAVSWFAQLPGPIKTVATAMALLAVALKTTAFASLRASLVSAGAAMTLFGRKVAFLRSTQGMGGLAATAAVAGNSAKKLGKNLLGAFGGPVGVAMIGATLAVSYFVDKAQKAAQAAQDIQDEVNGIKDSFAGGFATEQALQQVSDAVSGVREPLKELGVVPGEIVAAVAKAGTDGGAALQGLREKIVNGLDIAELGKNLSNKAAGITDAVARMSDRSSAEILRLVAVGGPGLDKLGQEMLDAGYAAGEVQDYFNSARNTLEQVSPEFKAISVSSRASAEGIASSKAATETATEAAKALTDEEKKALASNEELTAAKKILGDANIEVAGTEKEVAVAMTEVVPVAAVTQEEISALATKSLEAQRNMAQFAASNTKLATALSESSDKASDAKRALDFLQIALDTLSGRNRSAEEAVVGFNSSLLEMESAAKEAAKAGDLNKKALIDWNVAALTANDTGQEVYKALDAAASGYTEVTAAAYSNAAATGNASKAQDAARKAADSARASFIKQAQGMGLSEKQAITLANKMGILEGKKLTDKQFAVIAKDQQANDKLRAVDAQVVKDKNFDVEANTIAAHRAMTAVNNTKIGAKVAKILGDKTDANSKINQIKALGIPDKYAKIIAQANNLSDARAAINGVANDDYTAYINVTISNIQSAINSMISQINGAASGAARSGVSSGTRMAPQSMTTPQSMTPQTMTMSAMSAAPQVAGFSTMSTTASSTPPPGPSAFGGGGTLLRGGGNVIIVNGALDPDRVARQINGYVTKRNRRTGPVNLGRTALAV